MQKDGTYNQIFNKYNYEFIKMANLKERKLIKLENPFLGSKWNINDPLFWYNPIK